MADEVSHTTETKTTSDGTVNISVEKYDELTSRPDISVDQYNHLRQRAAAPPVINRTTVIKTNEMVADEKRWWGGSLMGVGGTLFAIGIGLFRSGRL